jgi:hypothetical protein
MNAYTNLNDAVAHNEVFAAGELIKVWYVKAEVRRDLCMGYKFAKEVGINVTPAAINETHVLLGSIGGVDSNGEIIILEDVMSIMQGEFWSPMGEARNLIQTLGLHHTSMSCGDVVQFGSDFYMVDFMGYKKLENE